MDILCVGGKVTCCQASYNYQRASSEDGCSWRIVIVVLSAVWWLVVMMILWFDQFTYICFQDPELLKFDIRCSWHTLLCTLTCFSLILYPARAAACMYEPARAELPVAHARSPRHAACTLMENTGKKDEAGSPAARQAAAHATLAEAPEPLWQISTRWHEQAAVSLWMSKQCCLRGAVDFCF